MTGETHRGVRRRAETGRDVEPGAFAVPGQTPGALAVESTVCDERAVSRDAELASVGVAGEHQPEAVLDIPVEDPRLRGVREAERDHGIGVGGARDALVVVRLDVRIADATELDSLPGDLDRRTAMREVEPAGVGELGTQLTPGQA